MEEKVMQIIWLCGEEYEQAERAGRKSTRYQCRWVGGGLFQRALVLVARQ
jgi:hypothetical protein